MKCDVVDFKTKYVDGEWEILDSKTIGEIEIDEYAYDDAIIQQLNKGGYIKQLSFTQEAISIDWVTHATALIYDVDALIGSIEVQYDAE
jgi:hypothetical protein